jgi:hypothetical protein
LFSKTLKECIQHITGQKIEELKGLERFYENEINELEEGDEFKKEIKKFIDNYETILLTLFTNLFYFYKKRIKIL